MTVGVAGLDVLRPAIEQHATLKWHHRLETVCGKCGVVKVQDDDDGTCQVVFQEQGITAWLPTSALYQLNEHTEEYFAKSNGIHSSGESTTDQPSPLARTASPMWEDNRCGPSRGPGGDVRSLDVDDSAMLTGSASCSEGTGTEDEEFRKQNDLLRRENERLRQENEHLLVEAALHSAVQRGLVEKTVEDKLCQRLERAQDRIIEETVQAAIQRMTPSSAHSRQTLRSMGGASPLGGTSSLGGTTIAEGSDLDICTSPMTQVFVDAVSRGAAQGMAMPSLRTPIATPLAECRQIQHPNEPVVSWAAQPRGPSPAEVDVFLQGNSVARTNCTGSAVIVAPGEKPQSLFQAAADARASIHGLARAAEDAHAQEVLNGLGSLRSRPAPRMVPTQGPCQQRATWTPTGIRPQQIPQPMNSRRSISPPIREHVLRPVSPLQAPAISPAFVNAPCGTGNMGPYVHSVPMRPTGSVARGGLVPGNALRYSTPLRVGSTLAPTMSVGQLFPMPAMPQQLSRNMTVTHFPFAADALPQMSPRQDAMPQMSPRQDSYRQLQPTTPRAAEFRSI